MPTKGTISLSIQVTPEATAVLKRSLELGNVDPATGGIRLRGARGLGGGFDIQVELAEGPVEGEKTLEEDGLRLFIDPSITAAIPDAVVALEPQHEVVVVRPAEP
jgi:Fe-S cluster assembly iron-binding protein IscA